ncbi:hypothetical protein GDO81_003511 [Engystomops pustulosus]|uniref:Uncharacterized protein n=1 Tax=Engystomops pustulosus TaxID=76066 RepID=A0AAV7A1P0_ENGPU|nr:hypothetical protein GDO81_003511 [Engystomops pustulosus]
MRPWYLYHSSRRTEIMKRFVPLLYFGPNPTTIFRVHRLLVVTTSCQVTSSLSFFWGLPPFNCLVPIREHRSLKRCELSR